MASSSPDQPAAKEIGPVPQPGDRAPSLGDAVQFPRDKPVMVVFLRHCGCPFAEKTFNLLTKVSTEHPEVHCVAVSQSTQEDTDKWIVEVGGEWDVQVVVNPQRDLFAAWGLGTSSTWYAYNPWTVWSTIQLQKKERIATRGEQSGSKWQIGGAFAVDANGFVRWSKPAASADEVPNFEEALKALAEWRGLP